MKKHLLIITLLLSSLAYAGTQGFFLKLDKFSNDYRTDSYYDEIMASDYILSTNKNTVSYATEMARQIPYIANCLEVDPIYLLAKIHKESTFYIDARSNTGAAGLSQMTGIAIQELRDQLGIRGNSYARGSIINKLTSDLKGCMGESSFEEYYNLHKNKSNSEIKKEYRSNYYYSIISGAVILKVFLAKNYKPSISLKENYRKALEDYNGEATAHLYSKKIYEYVQKIRKFFIQDQVYM